MLASQRFEQVCLRHALFLAPTPLGSLQIGTISRKWLSRYCCNLCVIAQISKVSCKGLAPGACANHLQTRLAEGFANHPEACARARTSIQVARQSRDCSPTCYCSVSKSVLWCSIVGYCGDPHCSEAVIDRIA